MSQLRRVGAVGDQEFETMWGEREPPQKAGPSTGQGGARLQFSHS